MALWCLQSNQVYTEPIGSNCQNCKRRKASPLSTFQSGQKVNNQNKQTQWTNLTLGNLTNPGRLIKLNQIKIGF